MKSIVNGLATEYSDEGSGTVLLMLHGWGDSLRTFDALAAKLHDARIIRLDLPGFGGSEMPPAWQVSDYADFVRDFLLKIGVSPDVVIGHSLGGRIAIRGIASGSLSAKKLVLIASAGNAKRKTLRNAIFFVLAKIGKFFTSTWPLSLVRDRVRAKLYASAQSDYLSTGGMRETFLNVIREDLTNDAQRIHIPTLLIWGRDDMTTPLSDGVRLAGAIQGSELKVVAGAGHFVHAEKTTETAGYIEAFI